MNNEYYTKDDKLTPYKKLVENLKESFIDITFEQIQRTNNRVADAMATIASLLDIPNNVPKFEFLVKQLLVLAYDIPDSKMVCDIVGPDSPWYKEIYDYLHAEVIPTGLSNNQHRTFLRKSAKYTIVGDTLYRRALDNTLLRCLDSTEAQATLRGVHEGICGSHSSGPTLAKKIMRLGYYWPTMEKDSYVFVNKCCQCQVHGDLIHAPAQELHPITSPWPFAQWGLDLIGKIHPTSSNGHKFIITATEYFTKWIEAIPMTYITGTQIYRFI